MTATANTRSRRLRAGLRSGPVPSIPYGGEDCLSAALVLPVLSEAEGSVAEGTLNQRPTTYKKQILHCVQNDNLRFFLGAPPGRPWFWVLLPKQKNLVVRGRHPAGEKNGRAGTQARPYTQTP